MTPRRQEPSDFRRSFALWARRVRARILLRRVATGLALGLVAGGALAILLWQLRLGDLRPWAAGLGLAGGLAGLLVAVRRRWSDLEVALYLDAKLHADESISTAVELQGGSEPPGVAYDAVVRQATSALDAGNSAAARPRLVVAWQALGLLGVALVVAATLAPLPPPPPLPPPAPGTKQVTVADLSGLEKIIALEKLDARDAAQRKRLQQIAAEARRLQEELARGMPQREAQARIAKLRDEIAAERLSFGDQRNRAGLEAAVRKLQQNPRTKAAAKALGVGDLTDFDEEMKRLANLAEKEDREAAAQTLKDAAEAARQRHAEALAESLEEQRRLLEERGAKADALRELAQGLEGKLSEQARRDLEEFGESGSPEAQRRLAEALKEALEGLSDEERKRLSEQLQKRLDQDDGTVNPLTKEQVEDIAKHLQTPEGKQELSEMLKDLAQPPRSPEAEREQGLGDADRGGAQCQRRLGVVPIPMSGGPSAGGKQPGRAGNGQQPNAGQGGPGSDRDDAAGQHDGKTDAVTGKGLRAKARTRLLPGAPMHGSSLGRAPARAGETANQAGTGVLGQVGPDEVSGVQRSEVPEEYREQVGRYFQP